MERDPRLQAALAGQWPEPRLRALQVEQLYRFAVPAAGFSFLGAVLTLAVLMGSGDNVRGALWFVWATLVTVFRFLVIGAYRQRDRRKLEIESWARLAIAGNLLAGIQWGLLGTLLFPENDGIRQLFIILVITSFVGGSLVAYAPVRGAHEALSLPASVPTAVNLFFVQEGVHAVAGTTAIFFCFAIVYFAQRLNRYLESNFRMHIQRDELLELSTLLNEKLQAENRELAHKAAVRGVSAEHARERAGRLDALFEGSLLPHFECDADGRVITCNRAAERLLGLTFDEIAGRPFTSFLARPFASKAFAAVAEPANVLVEVRDAEGQAQVCSANLTPMPAAEGIKPGFAIILSGLVPRGVSH